jgi:hypothetical protein
MFDELGANRWLGLVDCRELWQSEAAALFQPTSAIRYPVFKRGRNYSGHGPKPPSSPVLARWLREELAPELVRWGLVSADAAADEILAPDVEGTGFTFYGGET